jgi:hypothetical protein
VLEPAVAIHKCSVKRCDRDRRTACIGEYGYPQNLSHNDTPAF